MTIQTDELERFDFRRPVVGARFARRRVTNPTKKRGILQRFCFCLSARSFASTRSRPFTRAHT